MPFNSIAIWWVRRDLRLADNLALSLAAGHGRAVMPVFILDPAVFVRSWVPELRRVPDKFVHEPWRMSASEQCDAHCLIGQDYHAPIVDHALARDRALAAYRHAKPEPG